MIRLILTMIKNAKFVFLININMKNLNDVINDEIIIKKRFSKQKRCEKCENSEHNSRIYQKNKEIITKLNTNNQ
jgi:hypothetical protein